MTQLGLLRHVIDQDDISFRTTQFIVRRYIQPLGNLGRETGTTKWVSKHTGTGTQAQTDVCIQNVKIVSGEERLEETQKERDPSV